MPSSWDAEYDLIIIGSGAGSICASLIAAEAKNTALIIEKTDKIGGSTALSGGVLWVPDNPVMKRAGIHDDMDSARRYLDACARDGGMGTTPARREAFLRAGPEIIAWLEKLGMAFVYPDGYADYHEGEHAGGHAHGRSLLAEYFDLNRLGEYRNRLRRHPKGFEMPVSVPDLRQVAFCGRTLPSMLAYVQIGLRLIQNKLGRQLVGMGAALQGRLLEIALRHGVAFMWEAPVVSLLDDGGKVTGVEVTHNGQTKAIRARRGVLINAGGFARNQTLRDKYHPSPSNAALSVSNPGDTGEVQQMAIALGAATDNMDLGLWNTVSVLPNGQPVMIVSDMRKPHCLVVDADGTRFADESGSYVEFGMRQYVRNATTRAVPAWLIMDGTFRNRYRFAYVPGGKTPKEWLSSGFMVQAPTIQELAAKCGLPADQLMTTVDRFNTFAQDGVDQDFHRGRSAFDRWFGDSRVKPNPNLGAIATPPFSAVKAYPGDVGTFGGLVADEHARVLREDGSIIPGLYATGNSTASVMGRSYPGAGASISASLVFGCLAARHALRSNT